MARIRTVKPSFFRHEGLQELEIQHPGKYPMLVFEGLWGHCDKQGNFRWKPRTLKLDILPFLPFDMAETLCILEEHGYVAQFEVEGEVYGFIATFLEHQRINGREAHEEPLYPEISQGLVLSSHIQGKHSGSIREASGKHQGSIREASGKHQGSIREASGTTGREGKGREGNKEGNGVVPEEAPASVTLDEVVSRWNLIPGVKPAKSVTGVIRQSLLRRIRDYPNVEWWIEFFNLVAASDFLSGRKKEWSASLDWALGPKNMAKIRNGNYDNGAMKALASVPKSMVDLL